MGSRQLEVWVPVCEPFDSSVYLKDKTRIPLVSRFSHSGSDGLAFNGLIWAWGQMGASGFLISSVFSFGVFVLGFLGNTH